MNIWSLKKDVSIKHLLLMLTEHFQQNSYEILDNPMDDQRAVRLENPMVPGIQLYVFTYGQLEGCYGVHIEFPNLHETNFADTLEIHENVSLDNIIKLIITTLEIPLDKVNQDHL
jgi:hypothetical protein